MNTAIEIELRAVLEKLSPDDLHEAVSILLGRLLVEEDLAAERFIPMPLGGTRAQLSSEYEGGNA
jgi:hypothetical protein